MEKLEKVFKKIDKVFELSTALILGSMVVLIFLQVLFRKIFVLPLAWSEELAGFLFIWMTFIAAYVGARKKSHIGVSLIQDIMPKPIKKIMQILSMAISSIFFGILSFYCISLWSKLMNQLSPALEIPMAFVYLGMIIGSVFMCMWYLVCTLNHILNWRMEELR
ncbi:MAG: TRAP transporter small permease [Bacillota bacterium]|nr:TRAP transporter small permease [Bacillota bacterium]